jgi:hypothetical protein
MLQTRYVRRSVGSLSLGLPALLTAAVHARPAMAQTAPTAADISAAVARSNTLRGQRMFQEALDAVMPLAGTNNFDVLIAIGQAYEGFGSMAHFQRAAEWHTRALDVATTNAQRITGHTRRAAALGDSGDQFLDARLADRQRVVDLAEEGGRQASAGQYGDLAGAHGSFIAPGGQFVDFNRVEKVLELRSKAIELMETPGRLFDRAELVNARLQNPGWARNDADWAYALVIRTLDMSVPANWYARAEAARRYAGLGSAVIAPGRPNATQLRIDAINHYTRYIEGFEESGRNRARFGDISGAYGNRAAVYEALGGGANFRRAADDRTNRINVDAPYAHFARFLERANTLFVRLNEQGAAATDYRRYLQMTEAGDSTNKSLAAARIREAGQTV